MKNNHPNQPPVPETVLLSDVAARLHYKDRRSVVKWCRRNGVDVYDDGCNRKYLVRLQFEQARLKKFIRSLKERYGKHWQAAYEAYAGNDLLMLTLIADTGRKKGTSYSEYSPKGRREKQFLASLTDSAIELQ